MHELGISRNIVAIVTEAAAGRRVRRVTLEVGKLSGVMPHAIAFCFDAVAQGTVLEGAALEILEPAGGELNVKTMELEEVDSCATSADAIETLRQPS